MSDRRRMQVRKWLSLALGLILLMGVMAPVAAAAPAAIHGVVLDGLGRPVVGAELEFYRLGTGLMAVVVSDAGGSFRLEQSSGGGLWQIRASAVGFRTYESGWTDPSRQRYQVLRLERLTGDLAVTLRDERGSLLDGFAWLTGPGGQVVGGEMIARGRLVRRNLPAGAYRLLLTAGGYQPVLRSLTVAGGATATAVVELAAAGLTASGEVRDSVTGAPVPGAAVAVLRDGQTQVASGAAADGGRFRLSVDGAAAGSYQVRVTAPGYGAAVSKAVALKPGQTGDWSGGDAVRLEPLYATLSGQVLGVGGSRLWGEAQVTLHLKGFGEVASAAVVDGQFRFDQVPAGGGRLWRVTLDGQADPAPMAWTEFAAGFHALVLLQQQAAVGGAGEGALSAVVTDQYGAPLAGALVEVLRYGQVQHRLVSDELGGIFLRSLWSTQSFRPADPYTLRISKEGFATAREFTVSGQSQTELQVADRSQTTVRAQLRALAADLQGRVLNAGGEPVAGAKVSLVAGGSGAVRSTVTDRDGWYSYQQVALRPGEGYALQVEAKGFLPQSGIDATQAVEGGRALPTVRLVSAVTVLSGQVSDPRGEPLEGVAVALWGQDGAALAQARTDSHGLYRLEAPVTGLQVVTASLTGRSTALAEVDAGESRLQRDLVLLADTAGLEGRVLDEDGRGIAAVKVELLAEGQGVLRTVLTDSVGGYAFRDLPAGGAGWVWVRVRPEQGRFAGSLTHQLDLFPQIRLLPGERLVVDLLVR